MSNEQFKRINRIGKKLKELLVRNKVSVDELSEKTNIHRSLLFRYISGEKNPSEKNLNTLADFFDVPPEYLTETFSDFDENIFIYISNIRNDLFYTLNPNNNLKNLNKKRFIQIKNKYKDYYQQLPNYYKYNFITDFYRIVMKGLFMYMSGNEFAFDAEIIPYDKEHIPHRLELAIKTSKLSVQDVSEISGINRSLLQNYLAGRKNPSKETLERLTEALKLPKDYFIADWYRGVNKLNDSYIYSPLPKHEKQIYSYNLDNETNKKADKLYNSYWNHFEKIYKKCGENGKDQVNLFLEKSYEMLISNTEKELKSMLQNKITDNQ